MDKSDLEIFNLENEKYKDFISKISHENKGVEYDLKKRAIQFLNFCASDGWNCLIFVLILLYFGNFLLSLAAFSCVIIEFWVCPWILKQFGSISLAYSVY